MEMKIDKNIYLKLIAVLLCIYIAFLPFFQPKKVYANPLIIAGACVASLLIGMKVCGYVEKVVVSAEKLNELNEQATANLQSAFPDPTEYNKQLGILENLSNDLLSGKDIDWSKYSGKAIYAISKAVIDVLYPNSNYESGSNVLNNYKYYSSVGVYDLYFYDLKYMGKSFDLPRTMWHVDDYDGTQFRLRYPKVDGGRYQLIELFACVNRTTGYVETSGEFYCYMNKDTNELNEATGYFLFTSDFGKAVFASLGITAFTQNVANVQHLNTKITNKVKLPTRLPQSVINNYNTYINGESENLVIDPTNDELPQLPDNYNPVTDDPPDLDGYQDVTPDQEPTDTPDPTPSPTPEPTPSPDYDGSSWIKPIGDFFAGLLSFLKDALIPTQTVDFSPLQNMSTDFGSKFPFSLPGDIGKLFGVLQAEPRRPEFQMTFDLSKVGVPGDPIVWDLNFEQWDDAAAIVKTALYIGFLIGLVFISKNFMKN